MRVCIHRGSQQIGGSCVEVENQGQRLVIDMGLPLDADDNTSQYIPAINGLDGRDPSLQGILVSHSHIDHFGLLANVSPEMPVGLGPAARRILTAAMPFMRNKFNIPKTGWDFRSGETLVIGDFRATPFLTDHSAYDAYSILIEADGSRLFYSGDFRAHGRKATLYNKLIAKPPADVDALLLEGTTLGRTDKDSPPLTETDIESQLIEVFKTTPGLALVHTSVQNIDRVVSIFRASKRSGRRLIIDLYTATILEATANENIPQSHWPDVALFVPQSQRVQIKKNGWFDLLKRHSTHRIFMEDIRRAPERYTLLFRPLHGSDLANGKCLDGAAYVYSMWEGYWNRGDLRETEALVEQHAIPRHSIHTSGHADPAALKKFVAAVNPRKVIPIHSFRPDLYPDLFPNVELHKDGEWWEI